METSKAISELVDTYHWVQQDLMPSEPTESQNILRHLAKMLVLSCGSYYEDKLISTIKTYVQKQILAFERNPHSFELIASLSFFSLFDFPGEDKLGQAKQFLSPLQKYFGRAFLKQIKDDIQTDNGLNQQMNAFQEMCSMRNYFTHNNLIEYDNFRDKTFKDIKCLHDQAEGFLEFLVNKFDGQV